jgi:hypothetical protein
MMIQQPDAGMQAHPAITSPKVLEFFAYWNQIRAGRVAPAWPEVDPGAIGSLLPYVVVAEVLGDPFDIRYRIVGTAIIESFGYDYSWKNLRSMNYLTQSDSWIDFYRRLVERPMPCFGQYRIGSHIAGDRWVDSCTLPLSGDGRSVDRFIELEDWSMAGGLSAAQVDGDSWRFTMLDPPPG